MLQDISISFITHHLTTHMKKITILALSAFAASIMASCCCQDQGAPPLTPLPGTEIVPMVMKSKK